HFLQVNGAICKLLDCGEVELIGADQTAFSHPEEQAKEAGYLHELLSGRSTSEQFEKRYRDKNGKDVWTLVSVSLLRQNDEPFCYLFQVHDVSERKDAEYRLARLAHFDALTGLVNRAYLSDEIERQITAARRHQLQLAIVFLDLDHFKQVNDSLGHEAGDELLQIVANRLRASVRETDVVGRMGGDEFVILLPEIHKEEDILIVTDKMQTECAKLAHIAGHEVRFGVSIGVSLFPEDAQDSRTLLRFADSALYHAKAEGRNHLQFYRPELTARMERRMRLSAGLRVALERHEFELHYQPIVSLVDGRPLAAEALIRWNHPDLGMLLPDAFISLAEEIGMSVAIGEWVIGAACHQAALWRLSGASPLSVSVNVSASQFKAGNLVQIIQRALTATGLGPEHLCIEITEQLLLNGSEKNRATVAQLKALGVRVAIDDFGAGYSSLSYISYFGPTELKIDRSLIDFASNRAEHGAIMTAAIAMAHSLKLKVITEGVETEEQQTFLQEQGCEMAQGFLYAEPCAASKFLTWLRHDAGRSATAKG
ncbi:MAG TPA: EAL domain-containing protein, partial [Burkholderiales bacterium]|nr:EAL domain-containing protein [Burkholderiales bacterium]